MLECCVCKLCGDFVSGDETWRWKEYNNSVKISMTLFFIFLKKYRYIILGFFLILAVTAGIELWTGRSPLGPDGQFGWWEADVWSSENSQRVADA